MGFEIKWRIDYMIARSVRLLAGDVIPAISTDPQHLPAFVRMAHTEAIALM
ncbi:hypothetical protein KI387_043224, partial [Taxus chinensis]